VGAGAGVGVNLMEYFYSVNFFFMPVFAALYYKAADMEQKSGFLWGGISAVCWLITSAGLSWPLLGSIVVQGVLFVVMTILNVLFERKSKIIRTEGDQHKDSTSEHNK
jgi:membrane protein implicated in regulation of membrane protease activity